MRFNSPALILWTIIIILLISFTMSVYPTFIENQSKVMGMINLVPKGALQFKGVSNISDLTSVLGFYAVNNVIYMMVLGSIFAMVMASNILLKEEYNKTAEYLLTRPITRSAIFFSKLSVVMMYILILNLIAALAGFISMKAVHKESFRLTAFITLTFYTFLLNLVFGASGLFMSTMVKKPRPVTTLGIAIVMVLYFVFTISRITPSVSKIGYLSPFKYARTDVMSVDYGLNSGHLLYFAGISALMIFASWRIYLRKDIYT